MKGWDGVRRGVLTRRWRYGQRPRCSRDDDRVACCGVAGVKTLGGKRRRVLAATAPACSCRCRDGCLCFGDLEEAQVGVVPGVLVLRLVANGVGAGADDVAALLEAGDVAGGDGLADDIAQRGGFDGAG